MTVSTEIQKIKVGIKDTYIALEAKGATLPEIESLSNLATTVATIPSGGSGGDEIEVINNTGRAISVGDKVWVNNLSDNADTPLAKTGSYLIYPTLGFTKDGQYLFTGGRLNKLNNNNTLTELKNYNVNYECHIKHFNGKTYATDTNFTACINYPNNWDVDYALINDGYFVNQSSTKIRKYDLDTGALLKEYTGSGSFSNDMAKVVIDNILYDLSSIRRYYVFNDEDNTYGYYSDQVIVNNTDDKEIRYILGKTSDNKYYIDSNLNLIRYLGNKTFEVVAYEKMPAILQRWNGMRKSVNFNQDIGVLVVDGGSEYGIYRYDNGEWKKLNFELNRTVDDDTKKALVVNYDLTKYAFSSNSSAAYRVNVGTMQPNLKVMAQEFRWFNVNERTIVGVAKTSAEPDEKFTISTVLEPEIEVTVTTNADNAYISMDL